MLNIDTLIAENITNHYKLLTLVGNNTAKMEQIVEYLESKGWSVYDVEEHILQLIARIPPEKVKLRIGTELKKWLKHTSAQVVLVNANILYSPEMDKIGPFDEFKYAMRGEKEGILFLDAKLRGHTAIYSTPDRADYKEIDLSDVLYIALDEVTI